METLIIWQLWLRVDHNHWMINASRAPSTALRGRPHNVPADQRRGIRSLERQIVIISDLRSPCANSGDHLGAVAYAVRAEATHIGPPSTPEPSPH